MTSLSPAPHPLGEFAAFADALRGQYELECEIGRGGMGVVFRARDLRLDRLVAIKTLPPHLARDAAMRERFVREARTAGALSHQYIVPIHRADELGGHVFFVMGLVDGESLAAHVRDHGRMDWRAVTRVMRDVAGALAYAHSRGVIHRDVKAENILIERATGRAVVTDFGIARVASAGPLTATGQLLGSVYYLSPEQVSGEPVDQRSDIYSLGVTGFHALTAAFPFEGELASAVLIAHVNKQAPPVRTLARATPPALAEIIDRCLAKHPSDRFQNCSGLAAALVVVAAAAVAVDAETEPPLPDVRSPAVQRAGSLVSDSEAHSILGRAADLQALTGSEPRPSLEPVRRSAARERSVTSGHDPSDLRNAAIEAGIPARYVDRALTEHGLGAAATIGPVVDHSLEPHTLIGTTSRLELEVVVEGEMPADDFDLLIEIIRRAAGEAGQVETVGRSFGWQSHPAKGTMNISVLPRAGRTTIRVSENLNPAATGFFGGLVGGTGAVGLPLSIGTIVKLHAPVLAFALWGGAVGLSWVGARLAYRSYSRVKERELRKLIERLAAQARESIDQATPG